MANNNNNNNNNLIDKAEDKYGIPNKLNSAHPDITGESLVKISHIYSTLRKQINSDTTSLDMIQTFLNQYILALFVTNGNKIEESKVGDLQPHSTGDKCSYLGTKIHNTNGCKVSHSDKLEKYIHIMEKFMTVFIGRLSKELRDQMMLDEETMKLFTKAIRNLLYFYGQKQKAFILGGGEKNHFLLFFKEINASFGTPILQVGCDTNTYGCGRFVAVARCVISKRYYVLIHATQGEYSMNVASNYTNVVGTKSKACGGRRKTRKMSRKRTIRKN